MKFLVLHPHGVGPWIAVWDDLESLSGYLAMVGQHGSTFAVWVGEIGGKWVPYREWFFRA